MTAVIGLSISTAVVRRQQLRTQHEYQRAEANLEKARDAVDRMLTEFAHDHLEEVPFQTPVQRKLLEHAHQLYQDFAKQTPTDMSVRFETAQASHRVGDIRRMLGSYDEAREAYHEAIERFEVLWRAHRDRPEFRQHLARSYNFLGESYRLSGQLNDALEAYESARKIQERLTLDHSGDQGYRQELARTHYNLGLVLHALNEKKRAEQMYRQAIDLLKRLFRENPSDDLFQQELARSQINIGVLLKDTDHPILAENAYQLAIDILKKLAEKRPEARAYQRELGLAHVNLGNLLLPEQARRKDTRTAYQNGSQILKQLAKMYPNVPIYQMELANSINSLGGLHFYLEEFAVAERAWMEAADHLSALNDDFPDIPQYQHKLGGTLSNIAWAKIKQKDLAEAIQIADRAIESQKLALESNADNLVYKRTLRDTYWASAEAFCGLQDHADATARAELMHQTLPDSGESYFHAAALYAKSIPAAGNDDQLMEDERLSVVDGYRQRVFELLREAFDRNFRDDEMLFAGEEFEALQEDEEYRQLIMAAK
jgi:tetratricopeptide (TPR) repeat protein